MEISEKHEKIAHAFIKYFSELGYHKGRGFSSKTKLSMVVFGMCSIRRFNKISYH